MTAPAQDGDVQRIDRALIRGFAPFRTMTADELDSIIRPAQLRRIGRQQPVFRQGDIARHFYFLLGGRLKATQVTPEGHQIVVRIVHPGELFGIARALGRSDYPGTATAAVESVALAWSAPLWDELSARHPALTGSALDTVCRQMLDLQARVRELSTDSVERRIAHVLVRLAAQAGRRTRRGIEIDFPITRQDVAEMAGTTIPTVSRTLGAWAERGLVESGRLRIVLREPGRLLALAHGTDAPRPAPAP